MSDTAVRPLPTTPGTVIEVAEMDDEQEWVTERFVRLDDNPNNDDRAHWLSLDDHALWSLDDECLWHTVSVAVVDLPVGVLFP